MNRKLTWSFILIAGVVVTWWWYGWAVRGTRVQPLAIDQKKGGREATIPALKTELLPKQAGKQGNKESMRAFEERVAKFPLSRLIAEYELTGDSRYLEIAKHRSENDPSYLICAALGAKRPDADALKKLEQAQPDNALPNLLRAGMYADKKDYPAMLDELRLGLQKPGLSLESRSRTEAILDTFLADVSRATQSTTNSRLDQVLFDRMLPVTTALDKNWESLGSSEVASMELDLAKRLLQMDGQRLSNYLLANSQEGLLLEKLDPKMAYDENGMTVDDRRREIGTVGAQNAQRLMLLSNSVFSPSTDAASLTQFFARARADGEIAALNWWGETHPLPEGAKLPVFQPKKQK